MNHWRQVVDVCQKVMAGSRCVGRCPYHLTAVSLLLLVMHWSLNRNWKPCFLAEKLSHTKIMVFWQFPSDNQMLSLNCFSYKMFIINIHDYYRRQAIIKAKMTTFLQYLATDKWQFLSTQNSFIKVQTCYSRKIVNKIPLFVYCQISEKCHNCGFTYCLSFWSN